MNESIVSMCGSADNLVPKCVCVFLFHSIRKYDEPRTTNKYRYTRSDRQIENRILTKCFRIDMRTVCAPNRLWDKQRE